MDLNMDEAMVQAVRYLESIFHDVRAVMINKGNGC
jgi:hypothetical protein